MESKILKFYERAVLMLGEVGYYRFALVIIFVVRLMAASRNLLGLGKVVHASPHSFDDATTLHG